MQSAGRKTGDSAREVGWVACNVETDLGDGGCCDRRSDLEVNDVVGNRYQGSPIRVCAR